jgi:hypothetical protein
MMTMTEKQITNLLFAKGPAYFTCLGMKYIMQSIEREDGSGKCFNITAKQVCGTRHMTSHKPVTFFVRLA